MIALRPYQKDAIRRLSDAMQSHRRVLLQLPTGAGKTRLAAEIVRQVVANGERVLFLAHRGELVDQAADALTAAGLVVGAMSAGAATPSNPFAPVQIATVQTLLARRDCMPVAGFIVADEAHHYVSTEWLQVLRGYPDAFVLGLTATPERGDGRGLGELFEAIVVGATVQELTKGGHLVPCEIVRPDRLLESGEIARSPVDAYVAHASGRRAVVFARSVELAAGYAADFASRGIGAACVHGATPAAERAAAFRALREGRLRVLTNVFVCTEGFDAPSVDCVVIARGCSTSGTYLQMIGRALRPAPGKTDALVIDLRGVSHEFGRPDDERVFSLKGKGIRLRDTAIYCPVCGAERDAGEGCGACGWQPAGEPMKGDVVVNAPLRKYEWMQSDSPAVRTHRLARWIKQAHARKHQERAAFGKFYGLYKVWPSAEIISAARTLARAEESAA